MARGLSAKEHIEAIRTCWSLPHVCCIAPRRDHQRPIVATCMLKAHRETRATYSCHISISPPPLLPRQWRDRSCPAKLFQFNNVAARGVDCTQRLRRYPSKHRVYMPFWTLWTRVGWFVFHAHIKEEHLEEWLVLCGLSCWRRWHLLIWSTACLTPIYIV